jgi:putative molybdopterin biosynthesis protein
MADVAFINSFNQIKVLTDPRRLSILRLLMAEPATLTQLGQILGEHPAWVRHHLKRLEDVDLVEMITAQVSGGFVEKYYQAKAGAFVLQQTILPQKEGAFVLMGSHDIALNLLAQGVQEKTGFNLLILPVGSLEGLVALRQGVTHLTSCHLLDIESGEYNIPYVRHFFPDRNMTLITLAYRQQGLIVRPGNPLLMHGLEDLTGEEVTFFNRNKGSGTRLWLDKRIREMGIAPQSIRGYDQNAYTHTAVALAIQDGRANVGLGVEAAARKANLDFIPLFNERYDLVLPQEQVENKELQPLLDYLQSGKFQRSVEELGGYETQHTGEQFIL